MLAYLLFCGTLCVCWYVSVSQSEPVNGDMGVGVGGSTKINGANLQSYPAE